MDTLNIKWSVNVKREGEMTKQKKAKYPRKIYIQIEDEDGNIATPEELAGNEVTWCDERQNATDLVYYRKGK